MRDLDDTNILLLLIRACLNGNAEEYYERLNADKKRKLEEIAKAYGFEPWLYRYLHKKLPEERVDHYKNAYLGAQTWALINRCELEKLFGLFQKNKIKYIPIKGVDLAYRLYPDAALRRFSDWDIWFHPDDFFHALDVLKDAGWKCTKDLLSAAVHIGPRTVRGESVMLFASHHVAPFRKNKFMLEPHFTMPNFQNVDPLELWDYTMECPTKNGAYILSPELNLLLVTRHAASHSYFHANLPKMLADSAAILREPVFDHNKLLRMVQKWKMPYSGAFCAAFPDFFSQETISSFSAEPKETELFRKVLLNPIQDKPDNETLKTMRFRQRHSIIRNLFVYVKTSGKRVRCIYNTRDKGLSFLRLYFLYLFSETKKVLKACFRIDRQLDRHCALVEELENYRM